MDDYQRGVWAAYDAARGTNADLCTTPSRAYQLMLEAINKLRHAAPEQKVPAMTDPSPTAELIERLTALRADYMIAKPGGQLEWLAEQLCWWPTKRIHPDKTMCDGFLRHSAAMTMLDQAAALTSQAAEIERLREIARDYLDDAARRNFDGPGVRRARAAISSFRTGEG